MSRLDATVEIDLLDWKSPQQLEIRIVDRAALNDEDVDYILGHLPAVSMARVDDDVHKPFLGIDIFYDQDGSLRGVVFAFGSRALAIRIPTDIAKSCAAAYEKEKAAASKGPNNESRKTKGKLNVRATIERLTPVDRLRKILRSDLAGFGMAQISLTLWHTLRERVSGINLSTATSEPFPPPTRTLPEPQDEDIPEAKSGSQKNRREDGKKEKGGKGDSHKRKGGQGGASGSRGGHQKKKIPEAKKDKQGSNTAPPAILPEDEPLNWDRPIKSPGEIVHKIYPDASPMDVNRAFIGHEDAVSLEYRVAEAATRAWVSSAVANRLNAEMQNVPVVQPSRLPDKELTFFAESMVTKWKVLGETTPLRKLQLADFETDNGLLKSKNYNNKLRAGGQQYLRYEENGEEKRFFLNRPEGGPKPKHTLLTENEGEKSDSPSGGRGDTGGWETVRGRGSGRGSQRRQGQVRDFGDETSELQDPTLATGPKQPAFNLPENVDVFVYGREEATRPDVERDIFILRLLEGRGSLHGPKYRDCAFIRRVWFPTIAQLGVGSARQLKKSSTATRGRDDWIDDDWGDDTDEEEVARIEALSLEEGDEDKDDETEDEKLGMKDPRRGIKLPEKIRLNDSQGRVVARVVAQNPLRRTRATLVHGPPGTGKTSTIAAAVVILAGIGEPAWIVAQSNVGIKNVAEKLKDVGFDDFTLLVARDYFVYWEERYTKLRGHYFPTPDLKIERNQKQLFESKAVLCTLATLSSPMLEKYGVFNRLPLRHLIIDEASQIDMTSEFMHIFYKHRSTLQSVCWFGDPKQLPPFGWSEGTEIRDIFKVEHLLANSRLLDTSYRLPVPIAKYISRAVYQNELKSHDGHKVQLAQKAIVFVDVANGEEEGAGNEGKSWKNVREAEVVLNLIQTYYGKPLRQEWEEEEELPEYEIITPYEGQRTLVAEMVKQNGMKKQVYNVDSFQGNEADYIITTIAKTGTPGFLSSINRLNVLLTRCKRGLVIVTQKSFVQRAGGLLQGLWFSLEPFDPWVSAEDVLEGYVNLPGSPAPNVRPPTPESDQGPPSSRSALPPRPGTKTRTSAAQVVQHGMQPGATSTPAPAQNVKGVWGQQGGVARVKRI